MRLLRRGTIKDPSLDTSTKRGSGAGRPAIVVSDDPWGWGRSLEWATSSPPPPRNFHALPMIYSESPAFDLHHPDVGVDDIVD